MLPEIIALACDECGAHVRISHGPNSRAVQGLRFAMAADVACGVGYAAIAGLARLEGSDRAARGGTVDRWVVAA